MEISFVVDVTSVWLGVGLTLVAEAVLLFVVSGIQYSKQKRGGARRRL